MFRHMFLPNPKRLTYAHGFYPIQSVFQRLLKHTPSRRCGRCRPLFSRPLLHETKTNKSEVSETLCYSWGEGSAFSGVLFFSSHETKSPSLSLSNTHFFSPLLWQGRHLYRDVCVKVIRGLFCMRPSRTREQHRHFS